MINLPPSIKTPNTSSNIFRKPLAVQKDKTEYESRQRAGNRHMAYGYLGIAIILLAVYSFFFLYPQTMAFIQAPLQLQKLEKDVQDLEAIELPGLAQTRDLKKSAYNKELSEMESNIDKIFPVDVDKLGIVKRLENFATAIHAKNPPFEFNSITFGKPVFEDSFAILPISTSIYSSRANFDRFIELINLSGRLDSDIPIRLMEISNINIRLRGVDSNTGEDKGVDFSVKLNAYSRSQK